MTIFQDLQAEHEALLTQRDTATDAEQFVTTLQRYIERVCAEAANIPAPRERDQLRAILRFWASYVFDKTGAYPNTTLRPATNPETVPPPIKPPTPTPTPERSPLLWGIGILAVVAIALAALALLGSQIVNAPATFIPTTAPLPVQDVATQVYVQMQVNATMTKIIATISTATSAPTQTPFPTYTPIPTDTPTPSPTATATPVIVLPSTRIPPTPNVMIPETVRLDVAYQALTQGPSPFDPTVWVIQIRLVGVGGNGVYIFWVNGQQLPGNEYTVQGKSCEPQTLSLGVTSQSQAVKHDFTLLSPLIDCLKTRPQ